MAMSCLYPEPIVPDHESPQLNETVKNCSLENPSAGLFFSPMSAVFPKMNQWLPYEPSQ